MNENEELLEEIQRAFYDVVDVVETNLPETTGDEDVDQLIQEQLDQCNNAIVSYQYTKRKEDGHSSPTEMMRFSWGARAQHFHGIQGAERGNGIQGAERGSLR